MCVCTCKCVFPPFQLMATGVVGTNGPNARKTAALEIKLGIGHAIAQHQLTMAVIAFQMDQATQNL